MTYSTMNLESDCTDLFTCWEVFLYVYTSGFRIVDDSFGYSAPPLTLPGLTENA